MRRSRLKRAWKNFSERVENIHHGIMVLKNFEKREKNQIRRTGKYRKFCDDNYIEF